MTRICLRHLIRDGVGGGCHASRGRWCHTAGEPRLLPAAHRTQGSNTWEEDGRQHKIQDGPSPAWGWVIQAPCATYPRRTHGFAQQHSPRYGPLLQPRGRKAKAVQLPALHLHVYFMTTAIIFPPFPTKRWFEE